MYVFIFLVKVTEWPPNRKIAAHSAYKMFLWYKYLIVSLVFSHLGFWSGIFSLIAPFPDLCLLVPFRTKANRTLRFLRRNLFACPQDVKEAAGAPSTGIWKFSSGSSF